MTDKKLDEPEKNPNDVNVNLTGPEFSRLANNFYNNLGLESSQTRINVDAQLINYFFAHADKVKEKKKVAFVWICLNPPYWEFAKPMIEGAKKFFLPGHEVDYFLWSDMPKTKEQVLEQVYTHLQRAGVASIISQGSVNTLSLEQTIVDSANLLAQDIEELHGMDRVTIFPTEPIDWPMPTLMRYHTFLQQEEVLKTYDYIFYCDVDMAFVDVVGDEILGSGLTSGTNPMYYLDKSMLPPYEPNSNSTAYIPRPGRILVENNQPRFQPLYYAGGFQGGVASKFIDAMKIMRKNIDRDLANNYIAIWNEESHWNKYLFDHPEDLIVLNPSYIYPDSLHTEYYIPRWGRNYQPKLVTLTKKASLRQLSSEEQQQLMMMKPK